MVDPEFYYVSGGRQPVTETFDSYSQMNDWLDANNDVKHEDSPDLHRWNWSSYILQDHVQIVARPDGGFVVRCQIQHFYLSRDPAEINAVHYMTWDDFKHGRLTKKKRKAHFVALRATTRVTRP